MSRWHNHYLDSHAHFCTVTVAGRLPLLTPRARAIMYREWDAARRLHDVKILAYVVMPSHFHLVAFADRGASVRSFLQRTLALTSGALQPGGRFWRERPRVLPVYSGRVLETKVNYIHENPVKAELAPTAADWPDSSFRQLILGQRDAPFLCDGWGDIRL